VGKRDDLNLDSLLQEKYKTCAISGM